MTQSPQAPLLSLLIPTKDRYESLVPVVSEIARFIEDDRLEIVVCDNSSTPRAAEMEEIAAGDPRIRYHRIEGDISIVDNTERGLDLCRGDYLCFIGDDDLVSPHILQVVEWLKHQGADCLIYPAGTYWWPTVRFAKESRALRPGTLWLPKQRDGSVRQRDCAAELATVLARGGVAYMDLPRLYHGIASRQAVQRIQERFGRSVPGSSPDMALCVALALTNEHYLSIDYPVTIFGAARNSGGGRTAARKHYGRIEDQKHLPTDILDRWDVFLPRIWSEQIIYPQTIHEVMIGAGDDRQISYPALYASLLAYEPHIAPYLWPVLRRYVAQRPQDAARLSLLTLQRLVGRLRTDIRKKTGWGLPFDLRYLADVGEVMTCLEQLPLPAAVAAT